MRLKDLEVIVFDCQAAGSNPNTGALLEMGWMKTRAADAFDSEQISQRIEAYLIKPPADFAIPQRILKMTGIKSDELNHSVTPGAVWQKLRRRAQETAECNRLPLCPAVIHFSRYEEPFLRHLHKEYSPRENFPFQILCTHDLVKLLLPGLPRKGLRAVAGYFGQSISVHRRSRNHVGATAFIWHNLIHTLSNSWGIGTVKDFEEWLEHPPPVSRVRNGREYPMERELRSNMPEGPGIYKMYRSNGDILYVGKAKSLKSRVNSYFQKRSRHSEHILEMLTQAQHIITEPTETALEAALKESDEIKYLSPPYNIALQERERRVVFFSKNLRSCNENPCRHHNIGPFSTQKFMTSIAKMTELLNENETLSIESPAIQEILGSPQEFAPDEKCFAKGIQMFKEEFIDKTQGHFSHSSLLKLGSLFWKERLDERIASELAIEDLSKEDEDSAFELEAEEGTTGLPSWSPEKVARALKSIIRTGAHQARRARWFCRLSESTVAWDDKIRKSKERHVIVFEQGKIYSVDKLESMTKKPIPPGFAKPHRERQKNMDLRAFDRMRVLTTELKRLSAEKRGLEVCFGPQIILKDEQLQRILKWV